MKVKRSELLSVLDAVQPGIAKKEIIEQSTHYIFAKGEVATFSDTIMVTHPFDCDIEFSVKADDFYKIVSKIGEEEIDLTLDGDTLNIKSKKTKAGLSTIVGESAKVTHLIDAVRDAMNVKNFWKALPSDFIAGVHLCSFSASRDLSTGVKACCAINGDAIYTTDNIRASIYILESKMDEIILPVKCALELIKYNVKDYGVSENWAHFITEDGIVFNAKLMKGDYPYKPIEALFSDEAPILSFPKDLSDAVESVSSLAEGDTDVNKVVSVTIEKGTITVKAQKERGWITKTVDTDYKGDKHEILINPTFFCQILKQATEFALIDHKGMFMSDNFSHILSLPLED